MAVDLSLEFAIFSPRVREFINMTFSEIDVYCPWSSFNEIFTENQ